MLCTNFFLEPAVMMRPDAKVEKVYLYPKSRWIFGNASTAWSPWSSWTSK